MTRRLPAPEPPCPNEAEHTPCPTDYLGWWSWVERMNRTHGQRKCPGCGRWAIWYPRPAGSPAPCWGCGEAEVDPGLFGEDDELLCAGCQGVREAGRVAAAAARVAYRWSGVT